MSSRALTALLFVALLAVFAADVSVGCGQGFVLGPVGQKLNSGADTGDHLITVNGSPYDVPLWFYNQVRVGDTVKFDGKSWTVVKQGPTTLGPAPATPTTP